MLRPVVRVARDIVTEVVIAAFLLVILIEHVRER